MMECEEMSGMDFTEISDIYERKDDVKALFPSYKIIEHTRAEADYDYLDTDKAFELEIVNPHGGDNLYISFCGEFTMCFGDWHAHYDPYECFYERMKKSATAIVNNKYASLSIFAGEQWRTSDLCRKHVSSLSEIDLEKYINDPYYTKDEISRAYKGKKIRVRVIYWNPEDTAEFVVDSNDLDFIK